MCEKPEEVMPRKLRLERSKTCNKCKEPSGQILVRHFVYCKTCFLANILSKFKRQMPSPRTEDREEELPLTIAFSGGMGSSVLLDLVARTYRRLNARRKIWNPVTAVYVETCAAHSNGIDRVERIREIVSSYHNIELVVVRLEDAFASETLLQLSLEDEQLLDAAPLSGLSSTEALAAFLSAQPTPSARTTALSALVQALVIRNAPTSGPILFGTQLSALAVQLIAGVAHGAGFSLASNDPRIFRPLQDISAKECAAYVRWRELNAIYIDGPPSMESISGITREFITRLDRDFPSTVSAVARTCAKVVPRRDQVAFQCALCERPAQPGILDWKARTAIRSLDEAPTTSDALTSAAGDLCYGCHTMLTSRARARGEATSTVIPVPVWTKTTLEERRAAMRASISDFLIEEEDR